MNFNRIETKQNNRSGSLALDHSHVQKVITIAQEMISKNRVLKIKNLYDIAVKQLELRGTRILEIIQFLINNKILINGSKHTKETILSNLYRKKIVKVIYKNQGATFTYIRENVFTSKSGSGGQLIWHLEMLLKFNYIKKVKIGNHTLFIPEELDKNLCILNFLMKDELNRKIIRLLLNHAHLKKPNIYKMINEKRENVNYRIKNFLNQDIIQFFDKPEKLIMLSPKLRENLNENLVKK
ncbi:MAG: hypothetical protein JXA99_15800 [Candidatus Lokiarchaeota archaeon]|nr:hypothetical protein [Candidatus Lokiarchaeota archaeon]